MFQNFNEIWNLIVFIKWLDIFYNENSTFVNTWCAFKNRNTIKSQYNYQYICGNTSVRLALSDIYHCYQSTYENRYRWKTGCLFIYHTYWCMIFFISTYNTYNIFTFYSSYYANEWRYHESYRQVCCAGYRGPDCQRAYTAHL